MAGRWNSLLSVESINPSGYVPRNKHKIEQAQECTRSLPRNTKQKRAQTKQADQALLGRNELIPDRPKLFNMVQAGHSTLTDSTRRVNRGRSPSRYHSVKGGRIRRSEALGSCSGRQPLGKYVAGRLRSHAREKVQDGPKHNTNTDDDRPKTSNGTECFDNPV